MLLKDDVTVILLLSVSFMVTTLFGTDRYWVCGIVDPILPFSADYLLIIFQAAGPLVHQKGPQQDSVPGKLKL